MCTSRFLDALLHDMTSLMKCKDLILQKIFQSLKIFLGLASYWF